MKLTLLTIVAIACLVFAGPFRSSKAQTYGHVKTEFKPEDFKVSTNEIPVYRFNSEPVTGFEFHGSTNYFTDDISVNVQGQHVLTIAPFNAMKTNLDPNLLTFKFTDASNRVWVAKWEIVK